jgi:hypothetical protein
MLIAAAELGRDCEAAAIAGPTMAQPVTRGSTPVSAPAQANEAHVYG